MLIGLTGWIRHVAPVWRSVLAASPARPASCSASRCSPGPPPSAWPGSSSRAASSPAPRQKASCRQNNRSVYDPPRAFWACFQKTNPLTLTRGFSGAGSAAGSARRAPPSSRLCARMRSVVRPRGSGEENVSGSCLCAPSDSRQTRPDEVGLQEAKKKCSTVGVYLLDWINKHRAAEWFSIKVKTLCENNV